MKGAGDKCQDQGLSKRCEPMSNGQGQDQQQSSRHIYFRPNLILEGSISARFCIWYKRARSGVNLTAAQKAGEACYMQRFLTALEEVGLQGFDTMYR